MLGGVVVTILLHTSYVIVVMLLQWKHRVILGGVGVTILLRKLYLIVVMLLQVDT